MTSRDSSEHHESFLKLGNVVFVIAVYLYLIGWVYCYWLLNYFGIGVNTINMQFYQIFVYSYSAIFGWGTVLTFWGIFFFCLCILCVISPIFFPPKFKIPILTVLLILLIPASYFLAKQEGTRTAREIQKGRSKTISFTFKKDASERYPKEFITANDQYKLRIVTTTQDRFYVIHQLDDGAKEGGARVPGVVYDIPLADVLLAKIIVYPQ